MKRREFLKAGGGLAGLGVFGGGAKAREIALAPLFPGATVNAALNRGASDIKILGLGGFGGRMVSQLAYELRHSFEGNIAKPEFLTFDTHQDSVLQSTATMSPSSLVVLMAGMGGSTGSALIHLLAQQFRSSGTLTVAVVTSPEGDPQSAQNLLRLRESADVVFARRAAPSAASNAEPSVVERARLLLDAEKWMLQCVGGLLQAVALPSRTTLGIGEFRLLVAGANEAVYGCANGRTGQEIGRSAKAAIQQALADQGGNAGKTVRTAMIRYSGPAEQLRWPNIQVGKEELLHFLGADTPCLFGVQANEYAGYSKVQAEVWLTLVSAG